MARFGFTTGQQRKNAFLANAYLYDHNGNLIIQGDLDTSDFRNIQVSLQAGEAVLIFDLPGMGNLTVWDGGGVPVSHLATFAAFVVTPRHFYMVTREKTGVVESSDGTVAFECIPPEQATLAVRNDELPLPKQPLTSIDLLFNVGWGPLSVELMESIVSILKPLTDFDQHPVDPDQSRRVTPKMFGVSLQFALVNSEIVDLIINQIALFEQTIFGPVQVLVDEERVPLVKLHRHLLTLIK